MHDYNPNRNMNTYFQFRSRETREVTWIPKAKPESKVIGRFLKENMTSVPKAPWKHRY